MGTILALANQKGGVGKTTTAVNLAACLAEAGGKTLVLDLDPQANATSGLGERANGTSSYDLLDGAPLEEIAHPTRFPNLDLVPSRPSSQALWWSSPPTRTASLSWRRRLHPRARSTHTSSWTAHPPSGR